MLLMLSFRPLGLLSTLPVAHTFFGAFCWGIRLFYGEEKLKELLQSYKERGPSLLLSSPLPEMGGRLYFPKPACMGLRVKAESLHPEPVVAYRMQKRLKSIAYIPQESLRSFLEGRGIDLTELLEETERLHQERVVVPHASINRITSTTTGGELFFEISYALPQFFLLVYIREWHFEDKPEELLPAIFSLLPLGGNKSIGRGLFEVSLREAPEWLEAFTEGGDYFYSLSDFLYENSLEPQESYYDVEVKRPAVENYFGRGDMLWKSPMLFIKAGAVMKRREARGYHGRLKKFPSGVYHYGYAFPLYIRGEPVC